jgi:hypothetical protein
LGLWKIVGNFITIGSNELKSRPEAFDWKDMTADESQLQDEVLQLLLEKPETLLIKSYFSYFSDVSFPETTQVTLVQWTVPVNRTLAFQNYVVYGLSTSSRIFLHTCVERADMGPASRAACCPNLAAFPF